MRSLLVLFFIPFISAMVFAGTIHVPGDYPTIQAAIDAAEGGDTVLVAPGTYVENVDFLGKAVTLESVQGSAVTVIDGNAGGSTVVFRNREGPDSVLQGFTITNGTGTYYKNPTGGWSEYGGGIFCLSASPTIRHNTFTKNSSRGGGIYCTEFSEPLIAENTFTVNDDSGILCDNYSDATVINNDLFMNTAHYGAGIRCYSNSSPTIMHNSIHDNSANNHGGGIACDAYSCPVIKNNWIAGNTALYGGGGIFCFLQSHAIITGNVIERNLATGYGSEGGGIYAGLGCDDLVIRDNLIMDNESFNGGGIFCKANTGTIESNLITKNTVPNWGGGIYCRGGSPTVTGNLIIGNNSSWRGGGVGCVDSSAIVTNNMISLNSAGKEGGGIHCWDIYPAVTITNNTIVENSAGNSGGGIQSDAAYITVTNCVLWNNDAPVDSEVCESGGLLTFTYCDVKDPAWAASPGCFNHDPIFVDLAGGDYHLTHGSPCRNTGDNAAPGLPATDFEGDPRIAQADVGADEFYTHLYYTGTASPGGDVEGKLVGDPGTTPVGLFFGSGVIEPPIPTVWGSFHLQSPLILLPLVPMPASGVLILPARLPASIPVPYDLPMQGLVGLTPDSLTNLCILEVR